MYDWDSLQERPTKDTTVPAADSESQMRPYKEGFVNTATVSGLRRNQDTRSDAEKLAVSAVIAGYNNNAKQKAKVTDRGTDTRYVLKQNSNAWTTKMGL